MSFLRFISMTRRFIILAFIVSTFFLFLAGCTANGHIAKSCNVDADCQIPNEECKVPDYVCVLRAGYCYSDANCGEWQYCTAQLNKCEAKKGRCDDQNDCNYGIENLCTNHYCSHCGQIGEACCEGQLPAVKCPAGRDYGPWGLCDNSVCIECGKPGQPCCDVSLGTGAIVKQCFGQYSCIAESNTCAVRT